MESFFISFEGIEGCGKSTQIGLLADHLRRAGRRVVLTREPGGTVIGERIRTVLLDAAHDNMSPLSELLLYAASRNQHVREVIRPALEEGMDVLCDRYADATTAYQGAARKIDGRLIEETHRIATEGLWPHLTLLLDLSPELGLLRARMRNAVDPHAAGQDRFEREELSFHERVRAGYLAIAKKEPKRVIVIDAAREIDAIHADIIERVRGVITKGM